MTGATHMVVSAAIYRLGIFDPPTALVMAFGSHFLLDAIPHSHLSRKWNFVLGAAACSCLLNTGLLGKDYLLLLAAFLGALPDLVNQTGLSAYFSKIHNLHYSKIRLPKHFALVELLFSAILLIYVSSI